MNLTKKPRDALIGHLAHHDGLIASGCHSNSGHRHYTGSARYRCRCFDPGRSVSCAVSLIALLMSDWNPVLTIRSEVFNREFEDYGVDLTGVTVLELRNAPDITEADAAASIEQFRIT